MSQFIIDVEYNTDLDKFVVNILKGWKNNKNKIDQVISKELIEMSAEYDKLRYYINYDEHNYFIEKVLNIGEKNPKELTEQEICAAYGFINQPSILDLCIIC
jgi:hypothetical protein